jgi:carbon storage regulator
MLVLSRKVGQRIVIDENITIYVSRIAGHRVTLGLEAPDGVHIRRGELKPLEDSPPPATSPEIERSPIASSPEVVLDFTADTPPTT